MMSRKKKYFNYGAKLNFHFKELLRNELKFEDILIDQL